MKAILAQKKGMTQLFDSTGNVKPCTVLDISDVKVIGFREEKRDGYQAYILGKDAKKVKSVNKAEKGKYESIDFFPTYISEIRDDQTELKAGDTVLPTLICKEGDLISVSGMTKGKGFAGVVKLHHMHGGPKTHGQSNKHRSIGSIASGQTFAHVAKGRRMARKMGNDNVTIKNLKVLKIDEANGIMCVQGAVPGMKGTYIIVKKVK
ncbi:MAG: 50S ribosomal protein L3 [bacterium]